MYDTRYYISPPCSHSGMCPCDSGWNGSQCGEGMSSFYLLIACHIPALFSTKYILKILDCFTLLLKTKCYYEPHNVAGLLLYIILCLIISAVCTPPCLNGGICSQPDTCTCVEGWSGSTCGKYFVSGIITMQPGLMLKDGNALTSTKLRTRTINSMRAICYRSLLTSEFHVSFNSARQTAAAYIYRQELGVYLSEPSVSNHQLRLCTYA